MSRVLLDCDPGHDDAVAIVVAAAYTDLVGITTVHGNAPLEATTQNARIMRDLLGIDVPIHSGADRPLVVEPKFATFVHGESGLDGADLPPPTTPLDGSDAVSFIIDTVRASDESVWIVAVGPLTNVALALRSAPDLTDRLAGISIMGGGTFGNRTAAAEFNIWADPHAAAIVFRSGTRLQMCGLDVTHQLIVDRARIGQVATIGGRLADTLTELFTFFSENYVRRHTTMSGAALHDPCAVLAVSHPDLFSGCESAVEIETDGVHTIGMTVIDRRHLAEPAAPNCLVMDHIDDGAAWGLISDAIARFSAGAGR